jgi:hypothetical protein
MSALIPQAMPLLSQGHVGGNGWKLGQITTPCRPGAHNAISAKSVPIANLAVAGDFSGVPISKSLCLDIAHFTRCHLRPNGRTRKPADLSTDTA